ncbi:unnamed protein product [Symbiodinium natans]|uniref:Uncharacterized protein n=1 Tax=Symbiodinium natans TaxID=878477 RepID=A0A812U2H1_9DINO|nr:unnamed protein product [Symbiodinium natans]
MMRKMGDGAAHPFRFNSVNLSAPSRLELRLRNHADRSLVKFALQLQRLDRIYFDWVELPQEIVLYYRMLGVKPRGLERFENKYGESFPVTLPRVAKGEFNLAQQRTADRLTREKVQSTQGKSRSEQAGSKDTGDSDHGTPSAFKSTASSNLGGQSDELSPLSIQNSHLSLSPNEGEESLEDTRKVDLSSSSEEEKPKVKKSHDDVENLPLFLQEERRKLIREAETIGYRRYQITRALRDGIPSSSMDVLIDNMLYAGYGKLPNFKESAVAALSDDAPLPWNPFSVMTENKKKIEQLDDELEDYNAQLLALANPPKKVERLDILSTSGVLDCSRSRISLPRPPAPQGDPSLMVDDLAPSGQSKLSRGGSGTLSRKATGELGGLESLTRKATGELGSTSQTRNPEDEYYEDPAGSTTRQVEEAARRLRLHLSRTKSREGFDSEHPPIEEGDERLHAEADATAEDGGSLSEEQPPNSKGGMSQLDPAILQSAARGSTKLSRASSSISRSRSSKEAFLE